MGTEIILKNVRIAFAEGLAKQYVDPTTGKVGNYGASFLLSKDHPQLEQLSNAFVTEAKNKFGDKWELTYKGIKAKDKLPIHDGDLKTYTGYAGMYYVKAGRKTRPLLVHQDPSQIIQFEDGVIYSGCYVNVKLSIYAYNKGDNGISAEVITVQFVRGAESFGGGTVATADGMETVAPAEEDFSDIPF